MKTKSALICIILLQICVIGVSQSINNDVLASSGAYSSDVNNSIAWTIGEPVSETHNNSNNSLTQGFHQTGVGWGTISVKEISSDNSILIYPNPLRDELNIEFSKTDNYTIEIFDITGQLVYKSQISNLSHGLAQSTTGGLSSQISLGNYSTGIYLLNVKSENKLQSFRINKIN